MIFYAFSFFKVRSEATSRSDTPTVGGVARKGGNKARGQAASKAAKAAKKDRLTGLAGAKQTKPGYRCSGYWKEDHGQVRKRELIQLVEFSSP